ncbi:MAG: HAD family hydrolase, partial [Opitutaceae bacterium]
ADVLPEMTSLPPAERDEFMVQQQSLFHTVTLRPGAAAVLRALRNAGMLLGIASNAQPYTLQEVERALEPERLALSIFNRDLCFWSFEHGFSKPDPHVFRLLTARLRLRGVQPGEALMVGDRIDNDLEPAKAQGWQTWQLTNPSNEGRAGDWPQLGEWIA